MVQSRLNAAEAFFFCGERRQPWSPVRPDQTKIPIFFAGVPGDSFNRGTCQTCGELGDKTDHNNTTTVHSLNQTRRRYMMKGTVATRTHHRATNPPPTNISTTTDAIAVTWFGSCGRSVASRQPRRNNKNAPANDFLGSYFILVRSPFRVSRWVGRRCPKTKED
jgi:hypothetical protein